MPNLFTLYENKTDKPYVEKCLPDASFREIEKIPVTILGLGYTLGRVKQGISGGGYFIGDEGDQGTLIATDVHYAYTFISNLQDKIAAIKFAGKWETCIPVLNKYLKSELKSEDDLMTLIDSAVGAMLDGFCITANVSRQYGFYEIKLLNPVNGTGSEAAD